MAHELKTFADYHHLDELAYWRSTSGYEVDFILGGEIAIEIKAKRNVTDRDLQGLKALREEKKLKKYLVVSMEAEARIRDHISILPWKEFLKDLWERRLA